MTTPERTRRIMQEQRAVTIEQIDRLPLPADAKADLIALWQRMQQAVNAYAAEQDRAVDGRVLPELMRLVTDESDRVRKRLSVEGLAPPTPTERR